MRVPPRCQQKRLAPSLVFPNTARFVKSAYNNLFLLNYYARFLILLQINVPDSEMADDGVTIQIAPFGDLRLRVGHDSGEDQAGGDKSVKSSRSTYIVSSVVMCLASSVWNAMFNPQGHFAESQPSAGSREVNFAEDDPDALLLVLRIAHLQFKQVPTSLLYNQLLNVAIICDKYDVVGLVRPWYHMWEEPLKLSACKPAHEEWLFIAWTFGDTPTYKSLARSLVLESTINDLGQCFRMGRLLGDNMPPGAIG